MKIALDAMGGDRAPVGIVDGAFEAAREASGRFEIALVGKQDVLERYIDGARLEGPGVEIVDAPEVVEMSESPATAIRRKRASSIGVAMNLHREGKVAAVVSAPTMTPLPVFPMMELMLASTEKPRFLSSMKRP